MRITFCGFTITNQPARFGLEQAKAAMRFAREPGQAKAVLGTVMGVLGYENAIAADVAEARAAEAASIEECNRDAEVANDRIAHLRRQIAMLEEQITCSQLRNAKLERVAELFAS